MEFTTLRDADLSAFTDGAAAWRAYGDALWDGEEGARKGLAAAVRSAGWTGEAGHAAAEAGDQMGDLFETRAMRADATADVLGQAYEQLVPLQRDLRTLDSAVRQAGYVVDDRGTVSVPAGMLDAYDAPEYADYRAGVYAVVERYNTTIRTILSQAETIGATAAGLVLDLAPEQAGYVSKNEYTDIIADGSGMGNNLVIPKDDGPQANADWWASLTPEQQRGFIREYPERIAMMDGIPTLVRDEVNRMLLHMDIEGGYNGGHDPIIAARLLEAIEDRDHLPESERLYLLGYEKPGPDGDPDAKVILSMGNPDTAEHTGVYVPGMGTELSSVPGDEGIDRIAAMRGEAVKASGTDNVATVFWLGYDAPDDLAAAMTEDYARAGAPKLDSFVNGLNVTHDPSVSSHTTIVAHSYGSTLTGAAATSGDGLAVDDIVLVGSPGVLTDNAADMQVGDHVWVEAARTAPVAAVGNHGTDPAGEDFDPNRLLTDTEDHTGYWKKDSLSLQNMGSIIGGDYGGAVLTDPRDEPFGVAVPD